MTNSMNELQVLQQILRRCFPDAKVTIDEPVNPEGMWWLDASRGEYRLTVVWQRGKGFGLAANPERLYGEGVDESYMHLTEALPRILDLLRGKAMTVPPEPVRLRELREKACVSQQELAKRIGSTQASISRLEGRADSLISTLREYLRGLGGSLVLSVSFRDGTEWKIDQGVGHEDADVEPART